MRLITHCKNAYDFLKVNYNSSNFMYIDRYISFVSTSQLEIQKYSIPIRVT